MNPTIIVAGITRSGMSVTMQMLDAGGVPCSGTYPDYEPFPMGTTPWSEVSGKAVKLVDAHLHFPPPGSYRVIRLYRNFTEQAKSFNKWTKAFFDAKPASRDKLVGSFVRDYRKIDEWAIPYPTIGVHFEQIVEKPRYVAEKLAKFLGMSLDIEKMVSVVRPRSAECYPTLLEIELLNDQSDGRNSQ